MAGRKPKRGEPGGRPTKLTPAVQARICEAIRGGNYYEAACGKANITYRCFRYWMKRGKREKSGPLFQFFQAVRLAEAEAEVAIVKEWREQVPDDWHAARDFLERRYPERWGRKDRHEHSGPKGGPLVMKVVEELVGDA